MLKENEVFFPEEAYLYFPDSNIFLVHDMLDSELKNKEGMRFFFDGPLQLEDFEKKGLEKLKAHLIKNKYELDAYWTENRLLRFLQACAFKVDKAFTCIKEHSSWRKEKLPQKLTPEIEDLIVTYSSMLNCKKSGVIYIHGRDHKFRPIIILNAYNIHPKQHTVEILTESLTYLFELIIGKMMIPGQVENWIFIIDLKGMGLTNLPINSLKKIMGFLQHNFRGRLKTLYVVNTPGSIYVPWQIIKSFLEEHTIKKIQLIKGGIPEPIFTHANPEQVEKKFGGTAPNVEKFWPPNLFPTTNFLAKDTAKNLLISKEEYKKMYDEGKLKGYQVNMKIIEELNNISLQKKVTVTVENTESKSLYSVPEEEYHELMEERYSIVQRGLIIKEFLVRKTSFQKYPTKLRM